MNRVDLVNRVITAAVLAALAVSLGIWLTRSPLTSASAAPVRPSAEPVKPAETLPVPTLAPLPPPARVTPNTDTTKVEVKAEIALLPLRPTLPAPTVAAPPPVADTAKKPAEPQPSSYQYYYRRGWFRRR